MYLSNAKIPKIVEAVAKWYGMDEAEIHKRSNKPNVVRPRQVAMYLVRRLTGESLPEIGKYFDGRHHTTVLNGLRKVLRYKRMKGFRGELKSLEQGLEMKVVKRRVLRRC